MSFKSLFCKHEWVKDKTVKIWWDKEKNILDKAYDVYICPKCLKIKKIHYI